MNLYQLGEWRGEVVEDWHMQDIWIVSITTPYDDDALRGG